jgi:hypothetical protein
MTIALADGGRSGRGSVFYSTPLFSLYETFTAPLDRGAGVEPTPSSHPVRKDGSGSAVKLPPVNISRAKDAGGVRD